MKLLRRFWRRAAGDRGQTTSEYLLVIAVLAVTIAFLTRTPMNNAFADGSDAYKQKVGKATEKGHFAGSPSEER